MVIRLKRCPRCQRNDVERDAASCPGCGTPFAFRASRYEATPAPYALPPAHPHVAPAPHDVSIALSASLLIPGSGQMYNHQVAKGALLLALSTLGLILTLRQWSDILALILVIAWMVSILDAALIAGRMLNQEHVRPWQWF